ncbi:MAG: DegT/DnrJ/EryC1/StrS family aminotransferase, partial [bacterium]
TLRCDGADARDSIRARLHAAGIPTAIYYPRPLHQQGAFAGAINADEKMPVAEMLSQQVFSLPMHPYLREEDRTRIIDAVKAAVAAE